MINNDNITEIISTLREEVKEYDVPIVTLIAETDRDPYKVLISAMISARTKDEVTSKVSKKLYEEAPDLKRLSSLSKKEIENLIYPAGFYKTKARRIKKTAEILLKEHDGNIPEEIPELLELPGVGRKTANLVLTEAFNKEAVCVDTHVHRVSNRWGYVDTNTPKKTEFALRKKLPKKHWIEYNTVLVAFGQNTCTPRSPVCSRCPIEEHCPKKDVQNSR